MRPIEVVRYVSRHPSHLSEVMRYFIRSTNAPAPANRQKIEIVADWLLKAQQQDKGYAACYSCRTGWLPSYPETTGYIIQTMLNAGMIINDKKYIESARNAGIWLESQVSTEGFVLGGFSGKKIGPEVFDTAQIMEGFLNLITYNKSYLELSAKMADWIISQQDEDGAWRKSSLHGQPHSYYSRASMQLAKIGRITGQQKYYEAAWKNARWTIGCFLEDSSIESSFFNDCSNSFSHLTAYTIEGLLTISLVLGRELPGFEKIVRHLERIIHYNRNLNIIPGIIATKWQNDVSFECPTGSAQYAICLALLAKITKDPSYLNHAKEILDRLEKMVVWKPGSELTGAVPSSWPIWGGYEYWYYPNWAAKFYLDALIYCYELSNEFSPLANGGLLQDISGNCRSPMQLGKVT